MAPRGSPYIYMHKCKPGPYKLELHDAYRAGPVMPRPPKKTMDKHWWPWLRDYKRGKKKPWPEKEQKEKTLDEILGL